MTIKLEARVEKIEVGHTNDWVRITFHSYRQSDIPIVVEALHGEIGTLYKPGVVVELTIIPKAKP